MGLNVIVVINRKYVHVSEKKNDNNNSKFYKSGLSE